MVGQRRARGSVRRPAHGLRRRIRAEQVRAALDAGSHVRTTEASAVRRGAAAAGGGAALGAGATSRGSAGGRKRASAALPA
eukprot:5462359-Pleurochrysis_carterae.AAC.1